MNITVTVADVTGKPILKQVVGDGEYRGQAFDLCLSIPRMSPLVQVGGKTYLVNIDDIVKAVIEATMGEAPVPTD